MEDISSGQVTRNAAQIYDEFFLPALFLEWPPRVAEAAGLAPGQSLVVYDGDRVLGQATVALTGRAAAVHTRDEQAVPA